MYPIKDKFRYTNTKSKSNTAHLHCANGSDGVNTMILNLVLIGVHQYEAVQ